MEQTRCGLVCAEPRASKKPGLLRPSSSRSNSRWCVKIEGANANNFSRSLEKAGFSKSYGTPIEGDIAVIDALPGPNQYGHACIYDGTGTWYSDFVQRSLYPGPQYRKILPAVTIYRHK